MKVRYKKVKIACKECRHKFKIVCTQDSYEEWQHGQALIEDALYYLSDEERVLLVNHVCSLCAGVYREQPATS